MSLISEAARVCDNSAHNLTVAICAHLEPGGFVLHTDSFFCLARRVEVTFGMRHFLKNTHLSGEVWNEVIGYKKKHTEALCNPFGRFSKPNAWHLWVGSGDAAAGYATLVSLGGPLPYVLWTQTDRKGACPHLDGRLRICTHEKFQRLLNHGKTFRQQQRGDQAPARVHGSEQAGERSDECHAGAPD